MSDIKRCFVSRWGSDGYILEADFGQLEVVALAFLSGDKQLRQDILDKVDIHSVNAAKLFNKHLPEFLSAKAKGDKSTLEQRKLSKQLSFQLQYGAGAHSLATKNKIDVGMAARFIDNYYIRYPDVKVFQNFVKEEVVGSRIVDNTKRTDKGFPKGIGEFVSCTGRIYIFEEYDNPYYSPDKPWTKPTNFSPTQMKNYPVQGFATGDIVPLMLGKLYRQLADKSSFCKLINTVHDSIVLDVHYDYLYQIAQIVHDTLTQTPDYINQTWDIGFDLPLDVELKYGKNWGDMEKLDL